MQLFSAILHRISIELLQDIQADKAPESEKH